MTPTLTFRRLTTRLPVRYCFVEMTREGVPLIVTRRQLGHSNLGITSIYLHGIDNAV